MSAVTHERVLEALARVRDPELDESLPELDFVSGIDVDGATVRVRLRLPTFFCAPNFAYLMVADAHDAVEALDGVEAVTIELEDHFASTEINDAVRDHSGFDGAFPGESDGGMDDLRRLFRGKALVARQGRLGDALLAEGATPAQVTRATLASVAGRDEVARCVELRRELGIARDPDGPALVHNDGSPIEASMLERYLRIARLVRRSLEGNGGLCRSLLATRYAGTDAGGAVVGSLPGPVAAARRAAPTIVRAAPADGTAVGLQVRRRDAGRHREEVAA